MHVFLFVLLVIFIAGFLPLVFPGRNSVLPFEDQTEVGYRTKAGLIAGIGYGYAVGQKHSGTAQPQFA